MVKQGSEPQRLRLKSLYDAIKIGIFNFIEE